MEFLGDRVLGLVIAETLITRWPDESEGQLARRLAQLVSRETCAQVATDLDIKSKIIADGSLFQNQSHRGENVLGDICEALIGAIYCDGGYDNARNFIRRFWTDRIEGQDRAPTDPKSSLQEWAQQKNLPLPVYQVVDQSGPDHAPRFKVDVMVQGFPVIHGCANSKQDAQKDAAQKFLDMIKARKDSS